MRQLLSLACVFLLSSATQGATVAPPQTTKPAQSTILILPFSTPSGSTRSWMGRAIQQDLESDLLAGTQAHVLAPSNLPAATDAAEALDTAHRLNASIVIFGQAQSNGTDIRLNGQVLDVNSDKPFGALKATGANSDLFHLEDAIAGQTLAALPHSLLTAQAEGALFHRAQPQQQAPTVIYGAPQNEYSTLPQAYPTYGAPADVYGYNEPAYGYGYPAYTYPYPDFGLYPWFGFGGVVVIDGFGHFHHDHDFDHDDFDHDEFGHEHGFVHGGAGFSHGFGGRPGVGAVGGHSFGLHNSPAFGHVGGFRPGTGGGFHSSPHMGSMRSTGGFHGGFAGSNHAAAGRR